MTMSEYMDKYEKCHNEINAKDKFVVKRLTTELLFCNDCCRPFQKDDDLIEEQLTSPRVAFFDLVSMIFFVMVPIVWLPLVLIFGFLALKDWIVRWLRARAVAKHKYKGHNFDAEYFFEKKNAAAR